MSVRPPDDATPQLRLPVYIESFRARAPMRSRCTARLRTESMHSKGDAFYATVEFFDERGQKVAELRNIAATAGLAGVSAEIAQGTNSERPPQLDATNAQDPTALQAETFLLAKIAEKCGGRLPEGFDATMHFAGSGIDSVGLMSVLQELEVRIGQPVSPIALFEYPTIRDLAGYLVETYGTEFLNEKGTAGDVSDNAQLTGTATSDSSSSVTERSPVKATELPTVA